MRYFKAILLSLLLRLPLLGSSGEELTAKIGPIVENPIDYGWDKPPSDPRFRLPVYAKFLFEEMPSYRREATLKMSFKSAWKFNSPILIYIDGDAGPFDAEPIEFRWNAPILKGDIFEVRTKIKAREIGNYYINVSLFTESRNLFDYLISFSIDDKDQVYHLSRNQYREDSEPNHLPLNYLKNELIIKYRTHLMEIPKKYEGFQSALRITPVPKLEDTVDVHYSVVATRNFPLGVQLYLTASENLEVLNIPKNWVGKVKKGKVYKKVIKIVFKASGESYLRFVAAANYYDSDKDKLEYGSKWSEIHFQIGENGKLLYAGRQDKHTRPGKVSSLVAESMGERHIVVNDRNYSFLPKIEILGPIELKNLREQGKEWEYIKQFFGGEK